LDGLVAHIWPRVRDGFYGNRTTLHETQYTDVPSIFVCLLLPIRASELMSIQPDVFPPPFLGGKMVSDVMTIILYGQGGLSIMNHSAGLAPLFPRMPIETWKLAALCVSSNSQSSGGFNVAHDRCAG
jgi:hypothetical protein